MTARQAVDVLLEQYDAYKEYSDKIRVCSHQLAKQKLQGMPVGKLTRRLSELTKAQAEL